MPDTESSNMNALNIPINETQRDFISRAAAYKNLSIDEFVLNQAVQSASQILEQTDFILSQEKWDEFYQALDAPPRDLPALRELFSKPSVFHEQ